MVSLADLSMGLLAASGSDTVKLFDVSVESGDPCILSYAPSPGCVVNSVKWNHTNLVIASAGEDKKISLWRKNGQSMGTVPLASTDSGDSIEESILAISFSNKGSRYICSGGPGQVVRIWDLQRKRCIKWLSGHSSTITGAMYNCKDEHLASISISGDLILHNLASGARAAELKDPNQQVLRVLDYSRVSRHLLVTAGDDGTVHLWDTTGRSPKNSWLKQHSAPAAGIGFSPSNDKIIASIGMDKKLYTYDSSSRRPSSFISYEAPFSSLAFRDDGLVLAAGTSNGRIVFYDIRAKPQPFTVLRAYNSSEAVTSLCWQRAKPVIVNESNCTPETALLGGSVEDSILMPDPLPSVASSSLTTSTSVLGSRNISRSNLSLDSTSSQLMPLSEETPQRGHLRPGGTLSRLHAPPSTYNFKDDMEVFSPLVDVQPITPSLNKLWDDHDGANKKDLASLDKKTSSLLFPSSSRRFPFTDDGANNHSIYDWKSNSTSKQDDDRSFTQLGYTPPPSSKSDDSSITPPEAWGGEKISEKLAHLRQPLHLPSRFGMLSGTQSAGSMFSGIQDLGSSTNQTSSSSVTNSDFPYTNLRLKDASSTLDAPSGFPQNFPSSSSLSPTFGAKGILGQSSLDSFGPTSLALPRRFSTYAERISTTSSFSDGTAISVSSPKMKKTGIETKEELPSSLLTRTDNTLAASEPLNLPSLNGGVLQSQKSLTVDTQQGSFTLQLFQRTLEETLDSFQKSIHGDMRNLHIEILRQFHMQEMEMSKVLGSILEKQEELMKEVKCLRKENQQLRQLL
ncbi:protein NEDD1 isoform X1 [Punica granatum]|uniref:Protein NEDD1 isoform X1 n=1 Tax=Punica granatum TaxID=22663 RepID=A0A6P8BTN3_PUNGR|nr:protein NEDD1 isoform X1 [Punica granatum]XP_031373555.1 protein NEDD1 isoform X1 [Punica granatum]XP_031373556.1 protein NEDD1 isoform X1 [Punica granatum]